MVLKVITDEGLYIFMNGEPLYKTWIDERVKLPLNPRKELLFAETRGARELVGLKNGKHMWEINEDEKRKIW